MTPQGIRYDSFIDHYEATRAHAIVKRQRPRGFGAMLMARQTAGDWSDPPTPELGFSIVTQGAGAYSADLGAGRFRGLVRCGETIMVGPGGGASIQRDCAHAIIGFAFPYQELLAMTGHDPALPPDGDFGALHCAPIKDPLIHTLLQRLWREAARGHTAYATLQEGAVITIAGLLIASCENSPGRATHNALAAWQTNRAIGMMKGNLTRELTLRELAAEVRLSPYHFARAFKTATGLPPGRYHQSLRIAHAKYLLEHTGFSIGEIATACGYADPSYLARIFHRETGLAPGDYRRQRAPLRSKQESASF